MKLLKGIMGKTGLIILSLILMATLGAGVLAPTPVEAYSGAVTVYPSGDVGKYVVYIEYDQICAIDAGARVYFKSNFYAMSYDTAEKIADYTMNQPYWNSASDRSRRSIANEIQWHAVSPFHYRACIEYYYAGLPLIERQLFGR